MEDLAYSRFTKISSIKNTAIITGVVQRVLRIGKVKLGIPSNTIGKNSQQFLKSKRAAKSVFRATKSILPKEFSLTWRLEEGILRAIHTKLILINL